MTFDRQPNHYFSGQGVVMVSRVVEDSTIVSATLTLVSSHVQPEGQAGAYAVGYIGTVGLFASFGDQFLYDGTSWVKRTDVVPIDPTQFPQIIQGNLTVQFDIEQSMFGDSDPPNQFLLYSCSVQVLMASGRTIGMISTTSVVVPGTVGDVQNPTGVIHPELGTPTIIERGRFSPLGMPVIFQLHNWVSVTGSLTEFVGGFYPIGNVSELKISVNSAIKTHKLSKWGILRTDKRMITEHKVTVSFLLDNWIAENLTMALKGKSITSLAGVVAGEVADGIPGLVTTFQYISIFDLVLTRKSTSALMVPYVDDATPYDYKINFQAGSIELNDGSKVDPVNFLVTEPFVVMLASYNYHDQYAITPLTQPITDVWLHFEGLNTAENDAPIIVDIWKFEAEVMKELSLILNTFGAFQLEGEVMPNENGDYFQIKQLV